MTQREAFEALAAECELYHLEIEAERDHPRIVYVTVWRGDRCCATVEICGYDGLWRESALASRTAPTAPELLALAAARLECKRRNAS